VGTITIQFDCFPLVVVIETVQVVLILEWERKAGCPRQVVGREKTEGCFDLLQWWASFYDYRYVVD
jgi:hypothetical protein